MKLLYAIYDFMWGDLVTIPLPGGGSFGLSLLVLILVPAGIFFTFRTRFLPIRLFPEMIRVTLEKETSSEKEGISGFQALIVSTAFLYRSISMVPPDTSPCVFGTLL